MTNSFILSLLGKKGILIAKSPRRPFQFFNFGNQIIYIILGWLSVCLITVFLFVENEWKEDKFNLTC